ncbi:hypothetical protein NPX13_g8924 [Xylaria arbuscula]|uniref:Uncharacterized protein n=1 Tax=Xylaria arbuscula TaxID=114810 RepID=A0A9W8N7J2_9PEZI|nr:hypothetical protein NPX13_g8924 [Xylaria arbuscula]
MFSSAIPLAYSNPPLSDRVALLVFRQSPDGNHEILVGRQPSNPAPTIPTRDRDNSEDEDYCARCLGEVNFNIDLSPQQVSMEKSHLYSRSERSESVRVFILRSIPAFDLIPGRGLLMLPSSSNFLVGVEGWSYEFSRISNFSTQRATLVTGLSLGFNELYGLLNAFLRLMEPEARVN